MSLSFLYFWLYTLFLVIVWWFFIIIRIHAIKFKNFQTSIVTSLKILCFILIFLSISWYVALYFIVSWKTSTNIEKIDKTDNVVEIKETINSLQEEIY
jgi:glycerol-3-phosphate acyltransferase PlsY